MPQTYEMKYINYCGMGCHRSDLIREHSNYAVVSHLFYPLK